MHLEPLAFVVVASILKYHLEYSSKDSMATLPLLQIISNLLNIIGGWFEHLLLLTLACGPIPTHMAFIMDGNRRYARAQGKQGYEGQAHGMIVFRNVSP